MVLKAFSSTPWRQFGDNGVRDKKGSHSRKCGCRCCRRRCCCCCCWCCYRCCCCCFISSLLLMLSMRSIKYQSFPPSFWQLKLNLRKEYFLVVSLASTLFDGEGLEPTATWSCNYHCALQQPCNHHFWQLKLNLRKEYFVLISLASTLFDRKGFEPTASGLNSNHGSMMPPLNA